MRNRVKMKEQKNTKKILFEMMEKMNPGFKLSENEPQNAGESQMSEEDVKKEISDRGYVPVVYANNRGYRGIKVCGPQWSGSARKTINAPLSTSSKNHMGREKDEGDYIKPEDANYFKSLGFVEEKSGAFWQSIPGDDGKSLVYLISDDERKKPVEVGRTFSIRKGGWSRGGGWNDSQTIGYEVIEDLGNGKWKVRVTDSQHEDYRAGREEEWTEEQIKREQKG